GVDKELDLVRIAKAYMAIAGDGRGGIVRSNSLQPINAFDGRAKELLVDEDSFREFDVVFTNPPFGSRIKVLKAESSQFDLGHGWKQVNGKWVPTKKIGRASCRERE